MKNIVSIILLSFLFLFSSCMSMNGYDGHIDVIDGTNITYKTSTKYYDDLEYPFYILQTSIPLGKTKMMGIPDYLNLRLYYFEQGTTGELEVYYSGSSWRFMDGKINFKIDGVMYKYIDENPIREVLSGGTVYEKISNYPLTYVEDKDFIDSLKSCNSLTIQYYGNPYTFTEEQVLILNDFFSKNFDKTFNDIKMIHSLE